MLEWWRRLKLREGKWNDPSSMTRMRSLLFIILVKIRPYSFVKIVIKNSILWKHYVLGLYRILLHIIFCHSSIHMSKSLHCLLLVLLFSWNLTCNHRTFFVINFSQSISLGNGIDVWSIILNHLNVFSHADSDIFWPYILSHKMSIQKDIHQCDQ